MNVDLKFDSLKDFLPESIAEQVPELRTMVEIRKLLLDLKGRVVNNAAFRRELNKILQDPSKLDAFKEQLDQIAPLLEAEPNKN
jgi:type VI secretion system protein ImpB